MIMYFSSRYFHMCYVQFVISIFHWLSEYNCYWDFHRMWTSLTCSPFWCMDLNQDRSFCPMFIGFSVGCFFHNSSFCWIYFHYYSFPCSNLLMFLKAIRTKLLILGLDFLKNCTREHLFSRKCFSCQNFI